MQRSIFLNVSVVCALLSGSHGATAQVYDQATSFEGISSTDFVIGEGAETAHFTGGVSDTIGVFKFYHTGRFSWMIMEKGSVGRIDFETTASQVEFFARDSGTDVQGLIETFDVSGNLLESAEIGTDWGFYSFLGSIDHLTVTNRSGGAGSMSVVDDIGFNVERCLSLSVMNLVSGGTAMFRVSGGTSGMPTAVAFGFKAGDTMFDNVAGWCATFGFHIPRDKVAKRIAITGTFDGNGVFVGQADVESGRSGADIVIQAAQQFTCPDECVSNMVTAMIQ